MVGQVGFDTPAQARAQGQADGRSISDDFYNEVVLDPSRWDEFLKELNARIAAGEYDPEYAAAFVQALGDTLLAPTGSILAFAVDHYDTDHNHLLDENELARARAELGPLAAMLGFALTQGTLPGETATGCWRPTPSCCRCCSCSRRRASRPTSWSRRSSGSSTAVTSRPRCALWTPSARTPRRRWSSSSTPRTSRRSRSTSAGRTTAPTAASSSSPGSSRAGSPPPIRAAPTSSWRSATSSGGSAPRPACARRSGSPSTTCSPFGGSGEFVDRADAIGGLLSLALLAQESAHLSAQERKQFVFDLYTRTVLSSMRFVAKIPGPSMVIGPVAVNLAMEGRKRLEAELQKASTRRSPRWRPTA